MVSQMDEHQVWAVRQFAEPFYRSLDDAHGVNHGRRIARIACLIQRIEGGDAHLVEAGAWLHQFHNNLDDLRQGLIHLNLKVGTAEALYHIVEVCRPEKIHNAMVIEAKIVYDADALEVLGPHGAIREIYCNLCFRQQDLNAAVTKTIEVQELFMGTIQTATGKRLCRRISDVSKDFWNLYRAWEILDDSISVDP